MTTCRGFTLLELMTALAVVGVLATIGMPAMDGLVRQARATNTMHALSASLSLARLEAVRRNTPMVVCPSADARRCREDGVWDAGWIIFQDPDRKGQPGSADAVVQRFDAPARNSAVRATSGRRAIRFLPSGWASGTNVTLRLCDHTTGGYLGAVIVNNAGRVRTERPRKAQACRTGS